MKDAASLIDILPGRKRHFLDKGKGKLPCPSVKRFRDNTQEITHDAVDFSWLVEAAGLDAQEHVDTSNYITIEDGFVDTYLALLDKLSDNKSSTYSSLLFDPLAKDDLMCKLRASQMANFIYFVAHTNRDHSRPICRRRRIPNSGKRDFFSSRRNPA